MPTWLKWVIAAVAVIFILRDPVGAAATVKQVFSAIWTFGGKL